MGLNAFSSSVWERLGVPKAPPTPSLSKSQEEMRKFSAWRGYMGAGEKYHKSLDSKGVGLMERDAALWDIFRRGNFTKYNKLMGIKDVKGAKKPAVQKRKSNEGMIKAVKEGFFGSKAENTQANTNVILSGNSSVEVTKEALLKAARDVKAGVAGATKADELGLQIAYTQWGKIIAHVSSDGHISLKEIEETVRLYAPDLRSEMVGYIAAELAKELNVASGGSYSIKTEGASLAASSAVPSSMKWRNMSKLAFIPLVGLLVYYFLFYRK